MVLAPFTLSIFAPFAIPDIAKSIFSDVSKRFVTLLIHLQQKGTVVPCSQIHLAV
jgi:hypothetical protein